MQQRDVLRVDKEGRVEWPDTRYMNQNTSPIIDRMCYLARHKHQKLLFYPSAFFSNRLVDLSFKSQNENPVALAILPSLAPVHCSVCTTHIYRSFSPSEWQLFNVLYVWSKLNASLTTPSPLLFPFVQILSNQLYTTYINSCVHPGNETISEYVEVVKNDSVTIPQQVALLEVHSSSSEHTLPSVETYQEKWKKMNVDTQIRIVSHVWFVSFLFQRQCRIRHVHDSLSWTWSKDWVVDDDDELCEHSSTETWCGSLDLINAARKLFMTLWKSWKSTVESKDYLLRKVKTLPHYASILSKDTAEKYQKTCNRVYY